MIYIMKNFYPFHYDVTSSHVIFAITAYDPILERSRNILKETIEKVWHTFMNIIITSKFVKIQVNHLSKIVKEFR